MIEEENFIIETEDDTNSNKENRSGSGFPVRTQLAVLGLFLFILFTGLIVPKTIAFLNSKSNQAEVQASVSTESAIDKSSNDIKIESVSVRAKSAYVWDVVGQRALFEKNSEQALPLASITKLMTTLVAYELVPDSTLVTISSAAAAQQSGGSFSAGEVFKAKELADFALISSYNSAAYTLADSVGELLGDGDSVGQFIAAMNIRAEELNLDTLSYESPTGLDLSDTKASAYGSAEDVSKLVEYILLNNPEILNPTIIEQTRLYNRAGEYHDANNTNDILLDIPNLLGSKTGYTDLAGGNLTIAFDAGYNRPVIITVLGSTRNERFNDVKKLVKAVEELVSKSKTQ